MVLGGVASGKSTFAEAYFKDLDRKHYIATAQAFDAEMAEKIAVHKARRDASWMNYEAPLDLSKALKQLSPAPILVDCVSMWLSNHLLAGNDLDKEIETLTATIAQLKVPIVVVSNEVGFSPVSPNALGRQFQNAQGGLNQRLAAAMDQVFLVSAGLPVTLK